MSGDTRQAADDYSVAAGSCISFATGNGGGDLVYSYTAPYAGQYTFTVTPQSSSLDASIYVVTSCPTAPVTSCVGGADDNSSGAAETVSVSLTANEPVMVIVDSFSAAKEGPFQLSVIAPPQGATCDAPADLTDAGNGSLVASGDNTNSTATYASATCGGRGPEVYYALHLAQASDVTATAKSSGALVPVVDLLSGCGAGASELACGQAATNAATAQAYGVAAGDYLVVVDGYNGTVGPYDLNVQVAPAAPQQPGESCTAPTIPGLAENATVTSSTAGFRNDFDLGNACLGFESGAGPDQVYRFTPSANGNYRFTVTPDSTYDTALFLLDACSDTATSCLGAADTQLDGGAESFTASLTKDAAYYLVVDGYGANDDGSYSLTAAPVVAPPNDSCSGAVALTVGNPVSGDTSDAVDDFEDGTDQLGYGPDVVYAFTVPNGTPTTYSFTLQYTGGWDAELYVTDSPCGAGSVTPLAYSDNLGSGDDTISSLSLTPGATYYVVVDGYSDSDFGQFTLSVSTP